MNDLRRLDELISALARHLRINPLACDTVEGIAQWWGSSHRPDPLSLSLALAKLEHAGVLEQLKAADGRVRYRRRALTAAIDARLDRFIAGQF